MRKFLVALFLLLPSAALAQSGSRVVTTCGTLPQAYSAGSTQPPTVDINGQACAAPSGSGTPSAVSIANGADVAEGSTTDAACATDNGTCTVNAVLKRIAQRLTTLIANIANTIILQAGENHIGEVGGNIIPITPTVTTTSATIGTGESIGGKLTLTNAARVSGALGAGGTSGIIQDLTLVSSDVWLGGPLDVYFFNADPSASTCTNDAAFVLNSADFAKVIGIAHVTDFTRGQAASGNFIAQMGNFAKTYGLASSTSIYSCIVWRGADYTSAASSTTFKVNVMRN